MGWERSLLVIALIVPVVAACAEPDLGTHEDAVIEGPGPRKEEPPKSTTQGTQTPPPAPTDGAGGAGAETTSKGCDTSLPFASQELVVGAPDDDTGYGVPRLSGDELRAYYSSASGTLFRTERPSMGMPFSAGTQLLTFASAWQPSLTTDELMLVFSRGDDHEQLFVATRTSTASPFGTPTQLGSAVNNSQRSQIDPYLRGDGKELFFHRYNPSNSNESGDLFSATINGTTVSNAQPIASINSTADDRYPVVSADGLTIFWGSNRTDLGGKGLTDIYTATRATTSATFTNVRQVSELSSAADERPSWMSPDGCRLYFQKANSLLVAKRPAK